MTVLYLRFCLFFLYKRSALPPWGWSRTGNPHRSAGTDGSQKWPLFIINHFSICHFLNNPYARSFPYETKVLLNSYISSSFGTLNHNSLISFSHSTFSLFLYFFLGSKITPSSLGLVSYRKSTSLSRNRWSAEIATATKAERVSLSPNLKNTNNFVVAGRILKDFVPALFKEKLKENISQSVITGTDLFYSNTTIEQIIWF